MTTARSLISRKEIKKLLEDGYEFSIYGSNGSVSEVACFKKNGSSIGGFSYMSGDGHSQSRLRATALACLLAKVDVKLKVKS